MFFYLLLAQLIQLEESQGCVLYPWSRQFVKNSLKYLFYTLELPSKTLSITIWVPAPVSACAYVYGFLRSVLVVIFPSEVSFCSCTELVNPLLLFLYPRTTFPPPCTGCLLILDTGRQSLQLPSHDSFPWSFLASSIPNFAMSLSVVR